MTPPAPAPGVSLVRSFATLAVSLPLLAAYGAWVYFFLQRGVPKIQALLASRWGVVITSGSRGSWAVSGPVPWWKATAIELCQLPVLFVGVLGPFAVVLVVFFVVTRVLAK